MSTIAALAAICVLAALALAIWYVPAYRRFRGRTTVLCPETSDEAVVVVDAARYAATSLRIRPFLNLVDCSRWPGRAHCEQRCLDQLRNRSVGMIVIAAALFAAPSSAQRVAEYALPTAASEPWGIAVGPDGALWFTERAANKIGRIMPGVFVPPTEFGRGIEEVTS